MSRLQLALDQLAFARDYTARLLDATDPADWFRMPAGGVSHIGWQVGHIAMAQYGLCLFRIRGRQEIDTELMTSSFRKLFSKGHFALQGHDPGTVVKFRKIEVREFRK